MLAPHTGDSHRTVGQLLSEVCMSERNRRRPYITGEPELDRRIDALIEALPDTEPRAAELTRQIVTTAAKMLLERSSVGDLKLVNSALKELRWAFRVFGPTRDARKVTVFGSARTKPDEPAYRQALDFGARMAERGWGVITGAGEGIMAAAHGGAGREKSWGVNIELPFEQEANETVRGGPQLVNFKYFFTRKLIFVKETDAVVLFPGGFGTHDEGFEALTLIQTGKADPIPVVFVEPEGSDYWREWHAYVERHLKAPGLISPDDTALYTVTADPADAIEAIEHFYSVYHSQRYVGDVLVLRVQASLSERRLDELNDAFSYILRDGRIEASDALPAERGHLAELPRLVLHYNRADAAGLRRLIDAINDTRPEDKQPIARVGRDPGDARDDRGRTPPSADEWADPEDLD